MIWTEKLFCKYDFTTTFNKIIYGFETGFELWSVRRFSSKGHEIGCHTILHEQYPYFDLLFNGYDPTCPDGSNQLPYPTNEELREDSGNGCNIFGRKLSEVTGYSFIKDSKWGELTDEQCQLIRNRFSVFKNAEMIELLDALSQRYLGTRGRSQGSWDRSEEHYTRGIFTGCRTSENHEIWERIFEIQAAMLKKYKIDEEAFSTWSRPGSLMSGLTFISNGIRYYDRNRLIVANNLARFSSSILKVERSITDILRAYGFTNVHDTIYPGMIDGQEKVEQTHQLIFNSFLSRKDGLAYPTSWVLFHKHQWESEGLKKRAPKEVIYETDRKNNNGIYSSLENLRHSLASGEVPGCVWDTTFNPAEKRYWDIILQYCQVTGVEVMPKRKAVEACFNKKREQGNLIYNHNFKNTLEKYLHHGDFPQNPDGWIGNCFMRKEDDTEVLNIKGEVHNVNYGVPYGDLCYSVDICGKGEILYSIIRNNTPVNRVVGGGNLSLINADNYKWEHFAINISIPDIEIGDEYDRYEGMGEKVIGLNFVYRGELKIRNVSLIKTIS